MPRPRSIFCFATSVILLGVASPPSRGDRILLRGGGEIKGVIVPEKPGKPGELLVQTETGAKPVAFTMGQILQVIAENDPLDEYFKKRDLVAHDAQSEYDFGVWCETHKLKGLAEVHFQRAIAVDESFAPARKKLGFVLHNGAWLTQDQVRLAEGMIKVKGKWVSRQERDRLDTKANEKADQSSWARRIKILHRNLVEGTNEESTEAARQFDAIRDPAAIAALMRILGSDGPAVRVRLAHTLGEIPGPEARKALITFVLNEPELAVRQEALEELRTRNEVETVPDFTRALTDRNTDIVSRAAWALAGLNAKSAVPKLIPQLVRYQRRMVAPQGNPGMTASSGSGMPVSVLGSTGGYAGFGIVESIPIITPVVGPGAVAFGASSVPLVSGSFVSQGGGGTAVQSRPLPEWVTDSYPNSEVLAALESLTGRNFGFDAVAWRQWVTNNFRAGEPAGRLAPEP